MMSGNASGLECQGHRTDEPEGRVGDGTDEDPSLMIIQRGAAVSPGMTSRQAFSKLESFIATPTASRSSSVWR
jgi:hypothetical protein